MICPCETPEGQKVGIVKNLSLMAVVSIQGDTNEIELILDELGKKELIDPNDLQNSTKIFINGNWIGIHN